MTFLYIKAPQRIADMITQALKGPNNNRLSNLLSFAVLV